MFWLSWICDPSCVANVVTLDPSPAVGSEGGARVLPFAIRFTKFLFTSQTLPNMGSLAAIARLPMNSTSSLRLGHLLFSLIR